MYYVYMYICIYVYIYIYIYIYIYKDKKYKERKMGRTRMRLIINEFNTEISLVNKAKLEKAKLQSKHKPDQGSFSKTCVNNLRRKT